MAKKLDTKKEKIIIAMPCTDSICPQTAQAIAGAVIGAEGRVMDAVLNISCEIASSRTWLIQQALKAGATHLLFVDSDMVFPYDVIPKLLAHKKHIIGLEYNRRKFPLEGTSQPLTERKENEIYRAKYVGTGVMLIDLSIFEKEWTDPNTGKKAPWFSFGRDSQGALALGEDAWFCYTAQDNGYEVWVDPTIKAGHIGTFIY